MSYNRILVGYLDTASGRDALALGTSLAMATGAELVLATAPDPQDRDLPALARAHEADLVVLGSTHHSGLGRLVPGATADHLLGDAPCAVAVAPPGFAQRPQADGWQPLRGGGTDAGMRVVGVGYDGSHAANEALATAARLATRNGAAMRVYSVAPKVAPAQGADLRSTNGHSPSEAEAMREALNRAVAMLPAEARALPLFSRGSPAEELVKATQAGVDLLVLGSRRGGPIRRLLHNSVSATVINRARCPVLVLPSGVHAPELAPA